MAMADISILPTASNKQLILSEEVAAIHQELDNHKDRIHYELTPMSTVIEGDINDLFHVIQSLHKVSAERGWKRISMSVRIDDRRDGHEHSMTEKKTRVEERKT